MQVCKKKRERPKRRYRDCIKEDLAAVELTEDVAADRRRWNRNSAPATPIDMGKAWRRLSF